MFDDIIAAIATPPGEGGIGIIRVSGRGSVALVSRFFRCAGSLAGRPPGTLAAGTWADPCDGRVLDELLAVRFEAPHGYTGEEAVEVHAHGGRFHLRSLLQQLLGAGARPASPGEFTRRAFLNGRLDLTQAEAVADLIGARAALSRDAAARQLAGGLFEKVEAWRRQVVALAAEAEAACDFPEEEDQLQPRQGLGEKVGALRAGMGALLEKARTGRLVREGMKVVLCGRPNVGKSSLLNALLGSPRAIVTEIPGTTRDFLEEGFQVEGFPVRLVDTAGIRESRDEVEAQGVERSRAQLDQADLALLVLDGSAPLEAGDRGLMERVAGPRLLLANKADLPSAWSLASLPAPALAVSARTGDGLGELRRAILEAGLGAVAGDPGKALSEALLTQVRHEEALRRADAALARVEETLGRADLGPEFLAGDLRGCLDALGELVGATPRQEVLDAIFSKFCIGK